MDPRLLRLQELLWAGDPDHRRQGRELAAALPDVPAPWVVASRMLGDEQLPLPYREGLALLRTLQNGSPLQMADQILSCTDLRIADRSAAAVLVHRRDGGFNSILLDGTPSGGWKQGAAVWVPDCT